MKTLFKVLVLAVMMAAFSALTLAQEPDLATLVEKFKTDIKAKCGERDAALATGKTIIEKFGNDVDNKDLIDIVKKKVADIQLKDPRCKLETRYNTSYTAKNWPAFFAASKEIMAQEAATDSPLGFDVLLTHVSVGFNRADIDKVDTYNAETLNYAKIALQKLDANHASAPTKTAPNGQYGVFEPFETKVDAQTWVNFIVGYMLEKTNQKEAALPYYYKATQIGTEKKNDVSIYVKIGSYYFDKASALDEQYRKKHEENKTNKVEDDADTKKLLGLARGNADRAIDAFARARKAATDNKALPTAIAALTKTLGELYRFRFNIAPDAKTPELETYVAGFLTKTMPDPTSEVTPVVEEPKPTTVPTTTTNNTTTPTTPTKPSTTTPTPTPKTATTPTKPTSTTTTATPKTTGGATTSPTTEATTTKTTTKKPVTKKKGTR